MRERYYEEHFDDFTAIISGNAKHCRLTIFKKVNTKFVHAIAYQADSYGFLAEKKLKNTISDFRYCFTKGLYQVI